MSLRIEDAPLPALNDVLLAHGGFDVVAGRFSLYLELALRDVTVEGYMKPIIQEMDVYASEQEKEKGIVRKIYEALVGVAGTVLRNQPRDQVATRIPIRGRLDDPQVSRFSAVLGIIRNAFIEAVTPGLEQRRAERR
jgi:hypothetical protein